MYDFTEQEIDRISGDIDQYGLTYIRLKNELLDHICCQVELEMESGMTFNEAYMKVLDEMGKRRIRQIQDETLNLISKKYRIMKRLMYVLGVVAPVLVIAASLLKIFHLPGGSLAMTVGLFVTGMIFLPVFVMNRIRDTRRLDEAMPVKLYITGMISGMMAILGAMLKIQHLPGAAVLLSLGMFSLALVFLPFYASYKLKEAAGKEEPINKNLVIGGVIALAVFIISVLFKVLHWPAAGIVLIVSWTAIAVLFIPFLVLNQLRRSQKQIDFFFSVLLISVLAAVFIMALLRSNPTKISYGYILSSEDYESSTIYFKSGTNILLAGLPDSLIKNPVLTELTAAAKETCDYIDKLRKEMIIRLYGDDTRLIDENGNIQLDRISHNAQRSGFKLVYELEQNRLYELLRQFMDDAAGMAKNSTLRDYIKGQFSRWDDQEDPAYAWAIDHFYHSIFQSESALSMYKSNIRLIERELLMERAPLP